MQAEQPDGVLCPARITRKRFAPNRRLAKQIDNFLNKSEDIAPNVILCHYSFLYELIKRSNKRSHESWS